MSKGFYSKLAWNGIRKNKKFYTPYILTCIGMIMMYYIVSFLSVSPQVTNMSGGDTIQVMLSLGCGVISVFSILFLFYTNSFLMRRRKKEFGLYNILGMGKGNLARILLWETLIVTVLSLGIGLLCGIILSKVAELGMLNILSLEVSFAFQIEIQAVYQTIVLFLVIFALILLNSLRQIHLTNPIELLHSETVGEKPPKANWVLAVLGLFLLGGAYWLAVSIQDPLSAFIWFFVAVIMVIIGTYFLFIAGSVSFCKLLQKNKRYYYKTHHFISVSSMVYRMKRNGAGLASICILCTMVLVMVSSTICLYIGTEDSLRTRYPRHINLDTTIQAFNEADEVQMDKIRQISAEVVSEYGQEMSQVLDYRVAGLVGYLNEDQIILGESRLTEFHWDGYSDVWQIYVVPLEDYNRLMGQSETLEADEVLIYTTKMGEYTADTITFEDGNPMRVKKVVDDFADNGVDAMQVIPSLYIFVSDFQKVVEPLLGMENLTSGIVSLHWFYGFDLNCEDEKQIEIMDELGRRIDLLEIESGEGAPITSYEAVAKERTSFYGLYGGLFFLGVLLGIVFLFAAVLIIYYKQISEGYEDQSRFEIMQKVGMNRREIKKSINSQILTVFFLPLLTAGVHLCFAFPLIYKLLALFSLTNLSLLILVTVICYLIFSLFYVVIYRVTSHAYYSIVSGIRSAENG
ncbi:MAG TPA: ABC transporter permease [Candidatus Faecimorpha stercoravium]|nr:ABC transporter permease [Candidatus Faecimorpha stercoravium]